MASTQPDVPTAAPGPPSRWTGGRIVSVVVGAVLVLVSLGALAGGGAALWADQTQRQDGYLTANTGNISTGGYALTSDSVELHGGSADWVATSLLGRVRIRVSPASPARPVFVGVAPASAARSYLAGTRYATLTGFTNGHGTYAWHEGSAVPPRPGSAGIWAEQASGTGAQTLVWAARNGNWMIVVMNADASPGVAVSADVGATIPALTGAAIGLLVGGVILLAIAVTLIALPVVRAGRTPAPGPASPAAP
jgi:hypothetical protein